ncbi:DUF4489 domain-containing protein [Vallitalea okinawensis]|uniref:DUF4489 domain-containing protein n=1 Tax=Vallitalea okinawensis TaxID=2078660 RepID=UPI000CFDAD0F|nr:DUF4489 domain-containing protein [Vallitalea okinawensis]
MANGYYTGFLEYKNLDMEKTYNYTKPKPIILECGTCNEYSFTTESSILFMTNPHQVCMPIALGNVSIDTKCLCRPKVKIDFSCNVHFVELDMTGYVQIEFLLYRMFNFKQEILIGSWFFREVIESAQTFNIFYCDTNVFPECYQYSIRCKIIDMDASNINITNCHIAALAQSGCD